MKGILIGWMGWKNEMKWNEITMSEMREIFFLENIRRQKFLILAMFFSYKTANKWLVFRLMDFLFILFYFIFCLDNNKKNKD